MAAKGEFHEVASGYAVQFAWTEALYGNTDGATRDSAAVHRTGLAPVPRTRAAAVLALSGSPTEAEALLGPVAQKSLDLDADRRHAVPVADAMIALAKKRPADAVDRLRVAVPYELGLVAALVAGVRARRRRCWRRATDAAAAGNSAKSSSTGASIRFRRCCRCRSWVWRARFTAPATRWRASKPTTSSCRPWSQADPAIRHSSSCASRARGADPGTR